MYMCVYNNILYIVYIIFYIYIGVLAELYDVQRVWPRRVCARYRVKTDPIVLTLCKRVLYRRHYYLYCTRTH